MIAAPVLGSWRHDQKKPEYGEQRRYAEQVFEEFRHLHSSCRRRFQSGESFLRITLSLGLLFPSDWSKNQFDMTSVNSFRVGGTPCSWT